MISELGKLDNMITLISYNGSRFDDLFVQRIVMEFGQCFDCIPTHNSILSLRFGNIRCFDLNRYLTGSLAQNAKDFKCVNQKVEGYSHLEIQKLFEAKGDEELFKFVSSAKAIEYVTKDVLVLEELFNKTHSELLKIGIELTKSPTVGSSAMKVYNKNIKNILTKEQLELYKLDKKTHDFIRSSLFAGRSEAINGRKHVKEPVRVVDIKSLYPSVTGACGDEKKILGFEVFYPIGKPQYVEKRNEELIGFY
jgi:hypothetical protein